MLKAHYILIKLPFIKAGIATCIYLLWYFRLELAHCKVIFQKCNDAGPYDHVTLTVGKEEGTLILPPAY